MSESKLGLLEFLGALILIAVVVSMVAPDYAYSAIIGYVVYKVWRYRRANAKPAAQVEQ